MKRLFLGIFSIFCLIILLIGTINNIQIGRIAKYQIHLQQVDQLTQELANHSEKLGEWVSHPETWDKLATSEKARQHFSSGFWDHYFRNSLRVLGNQTVKEVAGNNRIDIIYTQKHSFTEQLELDIINNLAIAGFKENGAIGKMRQIVHALEKKNQSKQRILSIRRHEKDFIMRHDLGYAKMLNLEIEAWKKSGNYPAEMDQYQKHFNRLTSAIDAVFLAKGGLFLAWERETDLQLQNLRSLRKKLLVNNLEHSSQIQEFNSIMHIFIFLLGIILSVIFTMRLSKSVVSLQRTMESYIRSNYRDEEILSLDIPKNEFGKLIQHFLQLSHKINQDVKLLENRVERRTKSLQVKNEELETKHHEILHGMRYAKDLQRSLMSNPKELEYLFGKYELLFQPKDLVGGDFYWSRQFTGGGKDLRFFALADCTGHGVPGALLSVIGMQALDEIIGVGVHNPHEVLNALRWNVSQRLNRNNDRRYDGMDLALISIDSLTGLLSFSGAHLSAWILRDGIIFELKGQRMPVGWSESHTASFTTTEWELEVNDRILIFSDGVCDQFGGQCDKKWGKKSLRQLLVSNAGSDCRELFEKVTAGFNAWKGESEQTDDYTMIMLEPGIAFKKETSRKDESVAELGA